MKITSIILLFTLCGWQFQQDSNRISLHVVNKSLKNGKVVTVESDIYFQGATKKMLTRYTKPNEYIVINSATGETKMYDPTRNQVSLLQHDFLKTDNHLLFFFFTNQLQQLGMKEAGYVLEETHKEEGETISTYVPDKKNKSNVTKVTMVHENMVPVFAAFYNTKGKIERKIFYSNYQTYENFVLPGRITEINFTVPNDSTITRTTISEVKTGRTAVNSYFDFQVPQNAKLLK